MRRKVERGIYREIRYDDAHWKLLEQFRKKATEILKTLRDYGVNGYVHGSVARGDVHDKSDIDIVILNPPKPYLIELALEEKFSIYAREIVQATPYNAIKAYIYLDERTVISFPLVNLSKTEYEFYKFGGMLGLPDIENSKKRVPGVDKRLVAIVPTEEGHIEFSIIGREAEVSKLLRISIDTVLERERMLLKRDEKGRTGTFIRKLLAPDESFDEVLRELASRISAVRNLIRKRGLIL